MEFTQRISKEITEDKYLRENETVEEMFEAIAEEVASVEVGVKKSFVKETFLEAMNSGYLIPAGRILANARPDSKMKNYNNCFTIDVEDTMEGITNSIAEYMKILKTGGGVGFDVSKLRPKGSPLSKGGMASGPMSFLEIFDTASKTIRAGNRRGASIAILRCDHPDIEEFITFKKGDKNGKLTQFNISVGVTDAFMEAVESNSDWDLVWEDKVFKTVKAKKIYDLIKSHSFFYNEPGLLMLDTIERFNNGSWAFKMDRVNPCGEITMPSYSLCCLSSLNLTKFVKRPFQDNPEFEFDKFANYVGVGVRFLDNILDATDYPLDKIEDFSKQWRRIGLGITGLGDMLTMMKLDYDSQEALDLCDSVAKTLRDYSYAESVALSKEKGSFPSCNNKKLSKATFIKQLPANLQKEIKKYGLRNIGLNTIAPVGTGSLSLGQNCSSGVEPIFALEYSRRVRKFNTMEDDTFTEELVMDYSWLNYCALDENIGKEIKPPSYFKTTEDLSIDSSLEMQAVWQKYIDHSISKTVNFPSGSSEKDYDKILHKAWKIGLKGMTVFNPDGHLAPILSSKPKEEALPTIEIRSAPKRPKELPCDIKEVRVKGELMLVLVGLLNGQPYEVFCTPNPDNKIDVNKHKHGIIKKLRKGRYDLVIRNGEEKVIAEDIGHTFHEDFRTIARLSSGMLRHGASIQFVIDQLQKTQFISSFQKAVSRALKVYLKDGEIIVRGEKPKCEICEGILIMKDGCNFCPDCGWSKCG